MKMFGKMTIIGMSALALSAMGGNPPTYLDDSFVVTTATTLSGVTNCYEGLASAIRDNLTIDGTSYVRLKGGTVATLALGPAANQYPVVTTQGNSGLYGSYRNTSGFWMKSTPLSHVPRS